MARSLPETRHDYHLGGRIVSVALQRSARRSVGLKIDGNGLLVTLPLRFPLTDLDGVLRLKAGWIVAKLDELATRPAMPALRAGSSVDWLGEPRTISPGHARGGIDADTIRVAGSAQAALAPALEKLMRREARTFLAERLALWAERLRLQPSGFKLSGATSRWGSCTSAGTIRLNWRLMQAPLPVIDYVVIHELCHLAELNHSPRFWALVAAVCPDWQQKRAWLKREGARYFAW
ncbi:M48 family metallopeptidase [Chitinimonas arctica]|uniref:M48 family metallopeptidase n=1 Tax=Chitinimonas arctica TaxID=2594795 RepID=A0A516SEU9_9NEIS|nr:SprT family zinc-dependent metalloprotease [Chitinimonas arctica]QDQ26640.1 M48 family metallopeptidase [Chitinimonas arctica]